jgi:hypothetical protein
VDVFLPSNYHLGIYAHRWYSVVSGYIDYSRPLLYLRMNTRLEHMPRGKQYMVTALSVFFSFGAVVSALVAILVIPGHSCTNATTCQPDLDNRGWQYLLQVLAGIVMLVTDPICSHSIPFLDYGHVLIPNYLLSTLRVSALSCSCRPTAGSDSVIAKDFRV